MILFSATVLLLLCTVTFQAASAGNTTYVVALLGQDLYYDTANTANTAITYELVITNNEQKTILVDIRGIEGIECIEGIIKPLEVTGKEVCTLDHKKGLNGSEFSNKSIIVQSQDGFFTLQVFTRREDHNYVEGVLAIPIESLKGPHQPYVNATVYNYVVASFCDVGGYCQLAVAAFNDKTTISIFLPNNVEEIALCRGKGYFRTGRDRQFTLSKYEALQLETTFDLTGTVIYSSEPIVVFAGSRNVTNGGVVAHTMEQLVPSSHWGTEYIVQNLGTNGYGDILKIVSHWSDTKVTMKGFPPFIMTDGLQTAVRRLDKGFSSHIQASHPIQVVQITGLTYATENEISTLSMTVVPSVQNALTEPVKVACNGIAHGNATFYIVEEKTDVTANIDGEKVRDSKIKYTKYMTAVIEVPKTPTNISNGDMNQKPVRGVMKCGTAAMPISVLYNMNVTGTIPMEPKYTGGVCHEGKASTRFHISSGTVTPHTLDLHKEHVLELRVRACGETMLQFIVNDGDMQNSLFLRVTNKQVIVNKCFPFCNTSTNVTVLQDDNNFHTDRWDCEADMAFFWFLQKTNNSQNYFCFGIGKYDKSVCAGAAGDQYFQVTSNFTKVRMMAVASDAAFTWDFVDTRGCDRYESDWRCLDRWTNCSSYGTKFCTNDKFSGFANSKCAKFCGKCFADSYGRKFILKLPYVATGGEWCRILVSPLNKQTNVAVLLSTPDGTNPNLVKTITVVHGTLHDNGERYYDCSDAQAKDSGMTFHTIFSDDDISVVVINKCIDEINSYRVYPVDTFDTEFMMLDYNKQYLTECSFVTEHENVQYVSYFSINVQGPTAEDSERKDLNLFSRMRTTEWNDISGSLIIFDKPSAVFCGKHFEKNNTVNWFHQLLPVSVWAAEYVIPAFANCPFKVELLVVSNADNTIVNITGGFDATHTIYNRGDKVTQDIDATSAYRINASQKIGVGMRIYDPSNEGKSSFHVLPPSKNLHDTVVTSYYNKILETLGFNVKDVQTYFVDENLTTSTVSKAPDDYRHVHQNTNLFGMSVVTYDPGMSVETYDPVHWFVIPGNIRCKVLRMEGIICNMSPQGEGDNKDNECDGLSDEDVCYNEYGVYRNDRDLDGGFGEDCSETLNGAVVITKPKEPMCIEINKPPDQCWTACTCKCSWVEKYEATKNMSKDELEEAQQKHIERIQNELRIDTKKLPSTIAKRKSARDKRKSAANIGYIGIGMFALVFGMIFIMDISSLLRDARILLANLQEGFERLSECFKCFKRRREG